MDARYGSHVARWRAGVRVSDDELQGLAAHQGMVGELALDLADLRTRLAATERVVEGARAVALEHGPTPVDFGRSPHEDRLVDRLRASLAALDAVGEKPTPQ
jgi:hypothetical protein